MPGGHHRRRSRSSWGGTMSGFFSSGGSITTTTTIKRRNSHGKFDLTPSYWNRLKDYLNHSFEKDTHRIVAFQKIHCLPVTLLARVGAFLGGETAHIIVMALCVACISPRYSVLYGSLLALSLFCGNFLKNVFCMPRPLSPPVKVLDNEHDWGLPSTHTINAISLGGFVMYTLFQLNLSFAAQIAIVIALLVWTTLIVGSRIYLGVHSFIDVKVGAVVGTTLLVTFVPFAEMYADWVFSDIYAPVTLLLIFAAALYAHPRPYPTTSLYTSATILGMMYGLAAPCSIFTLTPYTPMNAVSWELSAMRFIGSALVLLGSKFIVKPIASLVARTVLNLLKAPYFAGEAAHIEAQPSFSHAGVLEQLLEHRRRLQLAELLHTPVDRPPRDPQLLERHRQNIELIFRNRDGVNLDVVTKFVTYASLGVIGICLPSLLAQHNIVPYSSPINVL